jgi:peptidoglycan/LPS O-acetylase OafA/YrhL
MIVASLTVFDTEKPRWPATASHQGSDMNPHANILPLTSLRGFAALAVVGLHFFGGTGGLMSRGYLGVDLFFMLSGFVLFHVYHGPGFSLRSFFAARLARTYPLHLLMLLMLLPAFGRTEAFSGGALLCNLTMTQVVCGGTASWNGISWSLSAEWFAYLLFPFVLGPLRRCPAWATWGLAVICLTMLAMQWDGLDVTFGPLALCRSFPEFLIGMVAYRVYVGRSFAGWGWFAGACSILPLALWLGAPDVLLVADFVIVLVSAPGVAWLRWRPFVFFGDISYSLYMVHLLVGYVVSSIMYHGDVRSAAWFAVAGPIVSICFATITYKSVEVPARLKLRVLLAGTRMATKLGGAGVVGGG